MRSILILICHDHQFAVTQRLQIRVVFVFLLVLDAEDLDEIIDFGVLHDLLVSGFSHVQQFSLQREHAVLVPTDDTQSGYGQRFGRISFRQNQSAVDGILGAGVVGVIQFRDS